MKMSRSTMLGALILAACAALSVPTVASAEIAMRAASALHDTVDAAVIAGKLDTPLAAYGFDTASAPPEASALYSVQRLDSSYLPTSDAAPAVASEAVHAGLTAGPGWRS